MTSETPQKGDCSRRSDENESDEIRLHARPARVTASRDHRGVLGGPICNRKRADLGPLEHLGLTLAAYAASGTARALARAKLRRAGIVRARSGTPNALESAAGYYARGRGSGGRSAHPLSTKAPVAGADVAEQPKARGVTSFPVRFHAVRYSAGHAGWRRDLRLCPSAVEMLVTSSNLYDS
jgi:hypothetical protein